MMETVTEFDLKYHSYLVLLRWIITVIVYHQIYFLESFQSTSPGNTCPVSTVLLIYLQFYPCFVHFLYGTSILAVVRSLRLLRLFKILNHPQFKSLQLNQAIKASKGKIMILFYFVLISTIIIGSIMYLVEGKRKWFH
jgi:voltage-gated potassium channel